tara:strand:+ start:2434 stop:2808 length:375 start_codon:yes stop_codon:yes gene_type:complete
MSALVSSSKNSYQSHSMNSIICPVCLEEVDNNKSLMAACNHSWCFKCNESINNHNINKCPICMLKFEPFIKNGKWKYENHKLIWKRGILDTSKKVKWKNRQAYLYNLFSYTDFQINPQISGIGV